MCEYAYLYVYYRKHINISSRLKILGVGFHLLLLWIFIEIVTILPSCELFLQSAAKENNFDMFNNAVSLCNSI